MKKEKITISKHKAYDDLTVRECLTWHPAQMKPGDKRGKGKGKGQQRPESVTQPETGPRTTTYLPKKGVLGRPMNRGYVIPEDPHIKEEEDEGNVIDALRGWPNHQQQGDGGADFLAIDGDDGGYHEDDGPVKDGQECIGDVISQRFLNEALRRRQEEEEKARAAEEARRRGGPAARNKRDIKGTKASQLRSIAMAEKVSRDPKDLWQMPKFKDNARTHLDTKQDKEKLRKRDQSSKGKGKGKSQSDTTAYGCGDTGGTYYDVTGTPNGDYNTTYQGYDTGYVFDNGEETDDRMFVL